MYTFKYLCSKVELVLLIKVSGFSNISLQNIAYKFCELIHLNMSIDPFEH